jgi:hypothetical protein
MSSKFILQNLDNYNKFISDSYSSIFYKYIDIINNYIILSFDYSYLYSNNKVIIKKGIETLHHVFNVIFLYTLNLELTCYHCDKATYYYIEFISQMSGDNNILQLTSKDVTLFVFKKTIFDLSNDNKIKHSLNQEDKTIIEIIKKLSIIYNNLIYFTIDDVNINKGIQHYKSLLSNTFKSMNYILSEDLGNVSKTSKASKTNNIKKQNDVILSNSEKYLEKLNTLEFILQILNDKEYNNKLQFIELFIKKLFNIDNSETSLIIKTIKDKVYDDCFEDYLIDNNVNKLISWLFSM